MNIKDLIVPILTFIGGGGLAWVMQFRLKNRQFAAQVAGEEAKTVDAAIQSFTARLLDITKQLDVALAQNREVKASLERIQSERDRALEEIEKLRDEVHSLKRLLEHGQTASPPGLDYKPPTPRRTGGKKAPPPPGGAA